MKLLTLFNVILNAVGGSSNVSTPTAPSRDGNVNGHDRAGARPSDVPLPRLFNQPSRRQSNPWSPELGESASRLGGQGARRPVGA